MWLTLLYSCTGGAALLYALYRWVIPAVVQYHAGLVLIWHDVIVEGLLNTLTQTTRPQVCLSQAQIAYYTCSVASQTQKQCVHIRSLTTTLNTPNYLVYVFIPSPNHMAVIVSQSFSTAYSTVGRGGAGAYLQQSMGERQGTPWTGRQSIAGQHTNNHTHTHSYT
ncbi:hypothetical protein AMECASPLE_014686 [Ameca splendens]|uniref:Secreted protein n=1 Tax=Ameca splendens TaxID=208324 RepID=A0ABV0ZAJ6_9TELE